MSAFKSWYTVAALAGAVALSGCSSINSSKDDKKVVSPLPAIEKSAISLGKKWSRGIGEQGKQVVSSQLLPAVDGDRIYAANADGRVLALETASGRVLWKSKLDLQVTSSVGAAGGLVAVGTRDGKVHLLDSNSGEPRWSAQASSEVLAAPAVSSDVVVVQAIDSRLQAFDTASGSLRWRYSASSAPLTLRGNAAPVITDGMVYSAFDNGKLAALDARTGLQMWEQRFAIFDGRNEIERVIDAQATPVVASDVVVAAAVNQHIVGFERGSGQPTWDYKASIGKNMAQAAGSVFAVDADDKVVSLRESTGREVWSNTDLTGRTLSAPAVIGDYVAVADKEGYIHLLSADTGSYSGRSKIGDAGRPARLLAVDGTLYALTASGKLYAFVLRS